MWVSTLILLTLGVVIRVSMVANLVIAGFFGASIPLVLDRLGQDLATSATVFITPATDVPGFVVFLGLTGRVALIVTLYRFAIPRSPPLLEVVIAREQFVGVGPGERLGDEPKQDS